MERLTGDEKVRHGRQYWFPMLGPILANYATVASVAEASDESCTLRSSALNVQGAYEIHFNKADFVAWWHAPTRVNGHEALFQYLCEHARVDFFPAADPSLFKTDMLYMYYRPALLDFDAEIDEEEEASCVTCALRPAQTPHLQCGTCRLAFKTQNMTPPGKLRNKKNALKRVCSVCKEKAARAVGTKCEKCARKTNKTPCNVCGVTGVKIQKGLCSTHYRASRRKS